MTLHFTCLKLSQLRLVTLFRSDLMFNLFGDRKAKLEKKYKQLLDEAFRLSTINRKQSDLKAAEADEVRKQLDQLESSK